MDGMGMRASVCFAMLGAIAVLLIGRLTYLQTSRAALNREAVARQRDRHEALPAPRGTIVDRRDRWLAYDRPVFEVRAEAYAQLPADRRADALDEFCRRLAADLVFAFCADPEFRTDVVRQRDMREGLLYRMAQCPVDDAHLRRLRREGGVAVDQLRLDFLVSASVDSAAVLERLEAVDRSRSGVYLHRIRRFERCYPDREITYGPVGFVGELDLGTGESAPVFRGMEAFSGLLPGAGGTVTSWQDARARRYWTAAIRPPPAPVVLQSTLDLELQRAATEELRRAVDAVAERYGEPAEWATLCLAEVATGNLLAMASYRDGAHPKVAAFSPTQCLYPPGSVVKPLVFAMALEQGLLDWYGERIDCTTTGKWRVPGVRRTITDTHEVGTVEPRQVLVESSNIGAVKVGMRLARHQMEDYLRRFRWGTRTASKLVGEKAGTRPTELESMSDRGYFGYTAPSLSMGYDYHVTPLQLLRAFVILLNRRDCDLRLYERLATPAGVRQLPPAPRGQPFLSAGNLELLIDAMRGVVGDHPQATGRHLAAELRALGRPGLVAGKTGTSEYNERREVDGQRRAVMVRSASFAGFAPAHAPRYVAICVLQKPRATAFWGGKYAAPAAGRLLLRALDGSEDARPGSRVAPASVRTSRVGWTSGSQSAIGR